MLKLPDKLFELFDSIHCPSGPPDHCLGRSGWWETIRFIRNLRPERSANTGAAFPGDIAFQESGVLGFEPGTFPCEVADLT